jgi:hypothetical protein
MSRRVYGCSQCVTDYKVFLRSDLGEHQRQHRRFTKEDQLIEAKVRQFHTGTEPPRVSHYISFPKETNVEVSFPFENMEGQK